METHIIALLGGLVLLVIAICVALKMQKVESFSGCDEGDDMLESLPPACVSRKTRNKIDPVPSDPMEGDEKPKELWDGQEHSQGNLVPSDCYPKDSLDPKELLPNDEATVWSNANPVGKGSLDEQNFLHAGFHVGINTVGQSLRNANLQLRSEPPNPTQKIGPWMQSTIEPDLNRKPLEISEDS